MEFSVIFFDLCVDCGYIEVCVECEVAYVRGCLCDEAKCFGLESLYCVDVCAFGCSVYL